MELHFGGLAPTKLVKRVRRALELDEAAVTDPEVFVELRRDTETVHTPYGPRAQIRLSGVLNVSVTVLAHDKEAASAAGLEAFRRARRAADWKLHSESITVTVLPVRRPVLVVLAQVA
jgi:hypothetical protein